MAKAKWRLSVRLIPERDADLIEWLQGLDRASLPHGEKTQRIKDALRRGMGMGAQGAGSPNAAIDVEALAAQLLPQIRAIVEAGAYTWVEQVVAQVGRSPAAGGGREGAPGAETDAFLATLDAALFLNDEDDL